MPNVGENFSDSLSAAPLGLPASFASEILFVFLSAPVPSASATGLLVLRFVVPSPDLASLVRESANDMLRDAAVSSLS